MHEASLVNDMLYIAARELEGRRVKRVNSLSVSVGVLSGVLPEAMEFAFDAARTGLFEDAELHMEQEAVRAECLVCGTEYEPPEFPFVCPGCGSADFRITAGEDVYLKGVDYEDG